MIEIRKPDSTLAKLLPPVRPRAGVTYVPSQFVLSCEHEGKTYSFNNLTKQCIEGTVPASTVSGDGHDDLIAAQFLVPEDKDECAYYNSISALMRAYTRKKGIRGYTILPTLACNARCTYCYEEGMRQVTMTSEVVEQTIRYILDTHEDGKVKLSWFGGEPLLGERIIDRICYGMREAGLEYKSSMISNGSLITPAVVRKMTEDWRLGSIQISMDGAEMDYVSRKRYYAYHDYYHTVMEAISAMSDVGISVNIRCNVDECNWNTIPQLLEDLSNSITHKENANVYFAPLMEVRQSKGGVAMWKRIIDARHLISDFGFRPLPFADLRMDFRVNHCMADGSGVVIGPDGSLYSCQHCPCEGRFGDVFHGVTNKPARDAFCRVDHTQEACRTCTFLPDCTNFASCPVRDAECRETHEVLALDTIRRMLDHEGMPEGNVRFC